LPHVFACRSQTSGAALIRLALAQLNSVVGDIDGNAERIRERIEEARGHGADLVLFPELALTGYPPEDLLLRPSFLHAAKRALEGIARDTRDITAFVGAPLYDRDLANACAVCAHGQIVAVYRKRARTSGSPGRPRPTSRWRVPT
jgi:NAD+ synthase (glutamine-hydrolysing)